MMERKLPRRDLPAQEALVQIMMPIAEAVGWPSPEHRAREVAVLFSTRRIDVEATCDLLYTISLRPEDIKIVPTKETP